MREGLGGPYKGPGVVGRSSWKARRGQEALPEGRKGLGGPTREMRGQEALQEVREGLGGLPRGMGGVGRPSQWSGRGQKALPQGREGSKILLEGRERSGGPPGGPGGVSRTSWMARRG